MGKFQFVKATKEQSRLRLGIYGPSGSGKTYSSLSIATGLAGKDGRIGFIDSERRTANKYADRFSFDTVNLEQRSIPEYLEAIADARDAGFDVLILDSISHAWKWLVEEVDRIAKAKYQKNTFAAWRDGDVIQSEFIDALLDFPGHVIATMRSRTEWTVERVGEKNRPQRVGLAPEQGKDIEYEFDMLMELSTDHVANVLKDRTSRFQDKLIPKPGQEVGAELSSWLSEGEHPQRAWLLREIARGTPLAKLLSKWQAGFDNGRIPEEIFNWGMDRLQDKLQGQAAKNGTGIAELDLVREAAG